jgi:hypothetical protein
MKTAHLDQNEARILDEQLNLQGCFLRATLAKLTGQSVPAPEFPADLLAGIEAKQSHVSGLQARISSLTGLAPKPTTPPPSLPQAPTPTQSASPVTGVAGPLSATAQLLQSEGCNSVSELRGKRKLNPRNYSLPRR